MQRPITAVGKKIKIKLMEMGITQKKFCEEYNLSYLRFCTMLRSNEQYR